MGVGAGVEEEVGGAWELVLELKRELSLHGSWRSRRRYRSGVCFKPSNEWVRG